jgi:hypothetical protein
VEPGRIVRPLLSELRMQRCGPVCRALGLLRLAEPPLIAKGAPEPHRRKQSNRQRETDPKNDLTSARARKRKPRRTYRDGLQEPQPENYPHRFPL